MSKFFFSSRRRHTRSLRDWSSDVCSSDLPHVGGSAAFRRFFRDELMPTVERRYRTTSESSIIGESLAGLFIVETFLREPVVFDHYIAFDPSLRSEERRVGKGCRSWVGREQ